MRDVSIQCLIALLSAITVAKYEALGTEDYLARRGDSIEIQCPPPSVILQRRSDGFRIHSTSADENGDNIFVLPNVTLEMSGLYECSDDKGAVTNTICLNVTDIPKRPHDIFCVTEPFLEYMQCCWNVSRSAGIATSFFLSYVQKITNDTARQDGDVLRRGNCTRTYEPDHCQENYMLPLQCCKVKTGYNATSEPKRDGYIYFEMTAHSENACGTSPPSEERDKKHIPSASVKPPPPPNLRAFVNANRTITVEWDKPNMRDMELFYDVWYRGNNDSWKQLEPTVSNSITFKYNDSYRDVDVHVSAMPKGSDSFAGMYSDWSKFHLSLPTEDGRSNKALLIVIIFIGLIVVISTMAIAYRGRKKLKRILVGASDRRLPSPNIFVPLDKDEQNTSAAHQLNIVEQSDVQASNLEASCFGEESFTEIHEPLLPNQAAIECDELPDYAVGIVANTADNKDAACINKDYNQDQPETSSTNLPCQDFLIHMSAAGENCSLPHSSDEVNFRQTMLEGAAGILDESDYACSYSTVPGYLSCTSPQQLDDNRSSSVETLTDYATFS